MRPAAMLAEILAHKKVEIEEAKRRVPLEALEERLASVPPPRSLLERLTSPEGPPHRVIAEIKRASPSKGIFRAELDPAQWGVRYVRAGAVGLSVLTDRRFFRGSLEDLRVVRRVVEIPLLRKDFLIDPYQVYEARAFGADVVLLILRSLENALLDTLLARVRACGMEALVEVHDERDLDRALERNCRLIAVNNRDLSTFEVDLSVTERLLARTPPGVAMVSASGIRSLDQILDLESKGARGFLIGEALVTEEDPEAKLRELTEWSA